MKKTIKKVVKVVEKPAVNEVCEPVCVKGKVLIAETNQELGREDWNALAAKVNELVKAINAL